MRYGSALALCIGLLVSTPRSSAAQASLDGFGALSVNGLSSLEGSSRPVDFGGRLSVDLVPGVQAIGEIGKMANVLPPLASFALSFLPVDVRVSALYGEGGVRFLAAPRSAVTPYVEASAGIARLSVTVSGLGPAANSGARAALSLLDRTDPIAGAGGGLMFRGGPVLVDVGYRYKQIFANSLVGTVIGAGRNLRSHQVRAGIGVRF